MKYAKSPWYAQQGEGNNLIFDANDYVVGAAVMRPDSDANALLLASAPKLLEVAILLASDASQDDDFKREQRVAAIEYVLNLMKELS